VERGPASCVGLACVMWTRILELLVGKGSDCGGENKIAFVCIHNEFKVFWGEACKNGGRPGIRRYGLAKMKLWWTGIRA
jgi:hypothetical protein